MHCSSSVDAPPPLTLAHRVVTVALTGVLLCAAVASATAQGPGFRILDAGSRLVAGVHRLHARIDFKFSDEAIDAMRNGVALTVSVESEVLKIGRVWDRPIATVQARYRIQVHALSGQYVVKNLSTGESTTYRNLDEMSHALGDIHDFPLLDDHVLDDDESYRVRLRAVLEIESLPTPLRLLAYFKSAWRLSSGWTTWPLER